MVWLAGCGDMDRGASHWLCTPGCVPVGPNGKRRHYGMHFGLAFDLGSRSACAFEGDEEAAWWRSCQMLWLLVRAELAASRWPLWRSSKG